MPEKNAADPKKNGFNPSRFVAGIGAYLLQILLPALVTGGLLYWLSGILSLWKLDRTVALVIFALLYVILCLVIVVLVSRVAIRDRSPKGYRLRFLVMITGGIIVPVALFSGVNLLSIAPGETYMARLIRLSPTQTAEVSLSPLSSAVIAAKNPYTKIEGIKAIAAVHSFANMEQLFAILNNDPSALANRPVADALSKAIAAYGADAKPELLAAFQKRAKSGASDTTRQPENLYDRYFASSIESLQSEINAQPLDDKTKQDQLQQVSTLANQIQLGLTDFPAGSAQLTGGDPVLNFVLDTFLQMTVTNDGDLYSFAEATAADTGLPDRVRGEALLLLAKQGSKADLPFIYQYLSNTGETIQADAFDAIASLNQSPATPAKTK